MAFSPMPAPSTFRYFNIPFLNKQEKVSLPIFEEIPLKKEV